MSDIRFNQWLHQSGTGGVTQLSTGHVGIGTTDPLIPVHAGNNSVLNVGVVTANSVYAGNFYGSGANLTSIPAGQLTGTVADARISTLTASKLTGALPAISGANLTGITGTTINNNANNRIITGSGTANTLEGEANLTFDGTSLLTVHVPSATGSPAINFTNSDTGTGTGNGFGIGLADNESPYIYNRENTDLRIATNNTERMRINAAGNVGINQTSPSDKLHVNGTTNFTGNSYVGGDLYMYGSSYTKGIFLGGSGSANKLDDYEEGSWTPSFNALSTGSVTVSHARYTKIGRMVFVQGYLTVNSTSGNNFEMSMPFAQVSYNIYAPLMTQVTMNNSDQVALRINNGSTQTFMKDMADNDDKKTYNNLNGSLIMFAGSYEAQ